MKKIIMLLFVTIFSVTVSAQGAPPLSVGEKQLNFGIGQSDAGIPGYISLDFAVMPDITVAPVAKVYIDSDVIALGFGGRGDYHFNTLIGIPNNFDFYAGAGIGVGGINIGEDTGGGIGLDWGLQVGGRWYWSPSWGLNLELGGGNGYGGTLGVSYKL